MTAHPPARRRIALVAHDRMKDAMVEWVAAHRAALAGDDIVATGTTAGRIRSGLPDLAIAALRSGPLGGDQQIGALIAEGRIDALVFFVDPLSPLPHDVDVKALTRLALVYDVPLALNPATATLLFAAPLARRPADDIAPRLTVA